ncbi:MAG TPA: alanine--tRNA ligase [Acidobacteriaceae bacterium]|jgi:alanyl-tRNA synthetase|nr:alanine--tRNA ligase [Acidobacteriaceae bacterium]
MPTNVKQWTGAEIREAFLRFFETKGHRRVHSSSLVPANDPTLLFTNAGMNQFKDVFLGLERRDYARATTSQKCVRAGGKHNDLENVGFTRRHHTFFEMLGNFSFGDYFKKDAIAFAWELVTSPEWYGIPKDRLYVTIFKGENGVPRDEEAYKLWLEHVPAERIFEFGMKDNFWQMGDTGPCGPCSEIFYDMGMEAAETPGVDKPFGQDEARYVEIWNLVFMQFDRTLNVTTGQGELNLLPKPSIDTGMGLERVAAVLEHKVSNFDTDLFTGLTRKAAELTGHTGVVGSKPGMRMPSVEEVAREAQRKLEKASASLRIIADHARASTFLISDGVLPSNEGRGYVLRKILRRGIRHGRLLGQEEPFMHKMVYAVRDEMQVAYPELKESADRVAKVVEAEERQFARVLEVGDQQLDQAIEKSLAPTHPNYYRRWNIEESVAVRIAAALVDLARGRELSTISDPEIWQAIDRTPNQLGDGLKWVIIGSLRENTVSKLNGKDAFHLYETYGLPKDFIQDACRDAGIEFDEPGFEEARAEEQARARASWKGGSQKSASPVFREIPKTAFEGYRQLISTSCEVLAITKNGIGFLAAKAGSEVDIVLDRTSFYADSGGQIGDTGWLMSDDHNSVVADVSGCTKPVQGVFAHRAILRQGLAVGDRLDTVVDANFRNATRRNHTATHLLHAALREVLGTHVKQAGSLVEPNRLRFDFSHFAGIADEELQDIEDIINRQTLGNTAVVTLEDVPLDVAVNEYHAMALFGEKYGEKVRVVKIGDFSTELCGGTHTGATGEIGVVKLLGEGSVSSGVRRVEAVTGLGALNEFRRGFEVARMASQLGPGELSPAEALRQRLSAQEDELKRLRRELDEARMKSAASRVSGAADQAVEVKGIKVLAQRVDALDRGQMRTLVDNLRNKLGSGVVVLGGAQEDGKVALIVGVTKDLTAKVQAGKVVGALAKQVGGSGGGRPDMAEAGGKDAAQLDAALKSAAEVVGTLIG